MKIITLNIWGGILESDLLQFLSKNDDTNIFLLQEVFHKATEVTVWDKDEQSEIFSEIENILPEHTGYFSPSIFEEWGLAMFIKNNVMVKETGEIFVHKHKESLVGKEGATGGRNIQYAEVVHEGQSLTIINFHGLWNGRGKTDTEDRLNQSRRIINYIKNVKHAVVLGGDFNLLPNTESFQLLERELGLKNLISDFRITSTRTSFYTKSAKLADYILLSPEIVVKNFEVLKDQVSDHSPLLLEI